jgi:hypothetical protein
MAGVAHELRTPVAVLQGSLEVMVDGVYPADAEHLGPLLEEMRLIDDLRPQSLAESGMLELHRNPIDVGLPPDVPDDVPLAQIDPRRVREVLTTLPPMRCATHPPAARCALSEDRQPALSRQRPDYT